MPNDLIAIAFRGKEPAGPVAFCPLHFLCNSTDCTNFSVIGHGSGSGNRLPARHVSFAEAVNNAQREHHSRGGATDVLQGEMNINGKIYLCVQVDTKL